MKVKCVENKKEALPKDILGDRAYLYHDFPVIEGKEYTVYAIGEVNNFIWYCICDEDFTSFPRWRPSPLFEITDPRLSQYWIFSLEKSENKMLPLLSFPQWGNDANFYAELVDGDSIDPAVVVFNSYKELMDLEFPDGSITVTAQVGNAEWLICPKCLDGWNSSNNRNGMVRCPNCEEVMLNPRYSSNLIE